MDCQEIFSQGVIWIVGESNPSDKREALGTLHIHKSNKVVFNFLKIDGGLSQDGKGRGGRQSVSGENVVGARRKEKSCLGFQGR